MHTLEHLDSADLRYRRDGETVDRDAVLPALSIHDRVGVVTRTGEPTDGLGAACFLLSCVLAFYDRYRERDPDFYAYPDYYAVQPGEAVADYTMLDVWPSHKSVGVDPDAEHVLRAVNDRAIDVLLVPDGPRNDPDVEDVTGESARRRVDACFLYAPDGRLDDPDFRVEAPSDPTLGWFDDVLDTAPPGAPDSTRWADGGRVVQGYRRLSLDAALERLPG